MFHLPKKREKYIVEVVYVSFAKKKNRDIFYFFD